MSTPSAHPDPANPGPLVTSRSLRSLGASGGSATAAVRAASAGNATTHGVFSNQPVLPGVERPEAWEAHRTGVVQGLAPEGFVETELAERVAHLLWRLKRLARYETDAAARAETAAEFAERALDRDLDRVVRYEAHLTRQLQATLDRLDSLQRRRRGAAEPAARPGRPPRLYSPSHPRFAGYPETSSDA